MTAIFDRYPPGWAAASLSELCAINPKHGKEVPGSTEVSFAPMAAVDDVHGELIASESRRLDEVRAGYTHFADGDVLFAKITPCMENGKTAVARRLVNGMGCGSTEFFVLRPRGAILPEFLHRFLRQESFRRDAHAAMTGVVGQARVPRDFLERTVLPVPPVPEQKRIVTKLDDLTARSRRAKEVLDAVPPLLEQLRQSILAAALRGGLSVGWRAMQSASSIAQVVAPLRTPETLPKRKKAARSRVLEVTEPGELPDGWRWVRLSEIADVQLGQRRAPEYAHERESRYIRAANIKWTGLDLTDVKTMGFADADSLQLRAGDVLLTEASGSASEVGKPAIWRDELPNCCFQATVLRLRPLDGIVLPEWLYYSCLADALLGRFAAMAPGVGILHLTSGRMREWPVALPPVEEQRWICALVGRALATVSKQETEFGSLRRSFEALESSISSRAFSGGLASQDPDDESAATLLGRIQAARQVPRDDSQDRSKTNGRTRQISKTTASQRRPTPRTARP